MLSQCFSEDIILVYEIKIQIKMEPNWNPEAQRGSVKCCWGLPIKRVKLSVAPQKLTYCGKPNNDHNQRFHPASHITVTVCVDVKLTENQQLYPSIWLSGSTFYQVEVQGLFVTVFELSDMFDIYQKDMERLRFLSLTFFNMKFSPPHHIEQDL